jgi:ATP-dependent helicase HrpB
VRSLPVDAVLPDIVDALRQHPAVIVSAPPGSGKTTRVPAGLLDAGLAGDGKVLLLQPRRAAARLVARRIASERGGRVGGQVGYRVRFDRQVSAETRLEVLTEGLLTRRLQSDPFLEGVGLVVVDEVHERSLQVDLALALVAEVQREIRDDLKLVVMSATLDPGPLQALLGPETPLIRAEGRVFPVDIRYAPAPDSRSIGGQVAAAVRGLLTEMSDGHVLVFLPGVREIALATAALGDLGQVEVLPLHGRLSAAAQDRALAPSSRRKVVLATNIAETSVTLDGVVGVVDTGLQRLPVFDAATGLTRLETRPIPRASADQRAGRAGRTRAGVCVRLWTRNVDALRPAFDPPEIARADLSATALELWAWGVDPREFRWLETPPTAGLAQATTLLTRLGALDEGGITTLGRSLAALPLHPRLARVVVAGHAAGCLPGAAVAAALATERDPWERDASSLRSAGQDDLLGRVALFDAPRSGADPRTLKSVRQVRDQLLQVARRALGGARQHPGAGAEEGIIAALIAGFPDRVALRRSGGGGRYLLASGAGATLPRNADGVGPECLIAISMQSLGRGKEPLLRVVAPIDAGRLPATTADEVEWDDARSAVVSWTRRRFGALVLREHRAVAPPDPALAETLLAAQAVRDPERALSLPPGARQLQHRVAFLRRHRPDLDLPDLLDLGAVVAARCPGRRSFAELRAVPLNESLTWAQRQAVDTLAPVRWALPTGSSASLSYENAGEPPVLAARIQQLFGVAQTPRVAGQPVVLHLLAPNRRPAQVTTDLAGFWQGSYADVRKDLRGRYPKHSWPEDPLLALPEDRPRRRP